MSMSSSSTQQNTEQLLTQVLSYHNQTKHSFTNYARGPRGLDWANQPNPFRRYIAAPLRPLLHPSNSDHSHSPLYDSLFNFFPPPKPISKSTISEFFYDSLALSAWKSTGFSTWSLRVNPSSGNLHPTEAYIITPPIESLSDSGFVAHYAPKEHSLEIRSRIPSGFFPNFFPNGSFLIGISSIFWREAWKYALNQLKEPCLLPMEKGKASSLFVNDGSFMERFKQLQEEKEKGAKVEESRLGPPLSGSQKPKPVFSNSGSESKASDSRRTNKSPSAGKLAFSLKQKSKLVAPAVKLSEDEEEDESNAGNASGDGPTKRQKLEQPYVSEQSLKQVYVAAPCPSDPTIKKVADKLASFVAKNGRQFEHITRQKNPGDTPFKFLFDESCADYKYYEYRLTEEEKALAYSVDSQALQPGAGKSNAANSSQRSYHQQSNYQIPASALYEATDNEHMSSSERSSYGESTAPSASDPIAMMEFYMKKAAQEEKRRQPKHSKDEMPPPASLQGPGKRGHHMGDYIPQEELEKFMANCNDVAAQKAAKEAAERARIQADNVGHRLLSKMGWREGEGLGSSRSGIADPIMAGNVKKDNLGVGASQPGEVTPDDDIYEQYKKRMMLGYRHRPNPLGNPRKAYY